MRFVLSGARESATESAFCSPIGQLVRVPFDQELQSQFDVNMANNSLNR
jgi:hypothetical protein